MIIHLAADGRPRVPLGDGVERRGGRGLDRDRARRHRRRSSRSAGRSSSTHLYLVGERGVERHPPAARRSSPRPGGELRPEPRGGPARRRATHAARGARGRPRSRAAHAAPGRARRAARRAGDAARRSCFVFSRAGVRRGGRAVPRRRAAPHRRRRAARRSARIAEAQTARRSTDDDLDVLGYDEWLRRARGRASPRTTRAWCRR